MLFDTRVLMNCFDKFLLILSNLLDLCLIDAIPNCYNMSISLLLHDFTKKQLVRS